MQAVKSLVLWQTSFGTHLVPERFQAVKTTKNGWPDLRYKSGRDLADWGKRLEAAMHKRTRRLINREHP